MTGRPFTPKDEDGPLLPSTEPRTQRAVPWVSPPPRVPRSASRLHSAQRGLRRCRIEQSVTCRSQLTGESTAETKRQRTALFIRGCSENADVDSAALVREITASTEPRMSKSGPLRTEQVGHSLTFVALTCNLFPASYKLFNPGAPEAPLCWWVWASGPFSSLGVNGPPVMERSVLVMYGAAADRP
jgi:hypothetical protein